VKLSGIVNHCGEWLRHDGPHNQIVLSSRVRLARNLENRAFPGWAKKAERLNILEVVRAPVEELDIMDDRFSESMQDLSPLEKQVLVERHLISREHAAKGAGSGVVMNKEQSLSLMINEEDHLRMQALQPGLQLTEAYGIVNAADVQLEETLEFAFDRTLGYLTACPSNVGTGMRASAMVHLPALVISDQINKIVNSVNKIGLAVRGLYGEGTEAMGNLFQVSNQITLGENEEEIIERLNRVILQVIEHEQNAREILVQQKAVPLLDQIGRAYGILNFAHSMSSKEALNYLSIIKLGIDLGVFPEQMRLAVDQLFIESQPAHLQRAVQKQKLPAEERDALRAEIVRDKLKKLPEPDISYLEGGTDTTGKDHDE